MSANIVGMAGLSDDVCNITVILLVLLVTDATEVFGIGGFVDKESLLKKPYCFGCHFSFRVACHWLLSNFLNRVKHSNCLKAGLRVYKFINN